MHWLGRIARRDPKLFVLWEQGVRPEAVLLLSYLLEIVGKEASEEDEPDREHVRRHRTIRSKGCLSNKTALAMVFKLVEQAQWHWRRLDGHDLLPKIILGVKFKDGIEVAAKLAAEPKAAAA
jgi:hypothetical protein